MSSLLIRNAMSSDLEKLVELQLSLKQHVEHSNPLIWKITEEGETLLRQKLEKTLRDSSSCLVVAEIGGEVGGFSHGQILHRTDYLPKCVGEISTIYVAKGFRRRGVGRRLVENLCQFFIREKVEQITLRYTIGNTEAEGFWNKLGLEPTHVMLSIRPEELKERCSYEINLL